MKTILSLLSTIQKNRTRPYLNEIPSHFINEIKAKGYKVNVFLISLLADPGEVPAPSPLILRPNGGPKGRKIFWETGPPSSEGLDSPLLLNEIPVSQKAYLVPPILPLFTLSPSRERIKYPMSIVTWFWNNKTCNGMRSIRSAINRESESLDGHLREILRHSKDTSFRPRASQARARGKLASKPKQKFNGRRTLQ